MPTKIVVIEKEVLDRMVDLRSELIILAEQVNESDGKYSYVPLPAYAETFTNMLERKQIPYYLASPSEG